MVTVNFSVPDEVGAAFDHAFAGQDRNAVIAELMRKAVAEAEQQAVRQRAFQALTERRALRPTLDDDEIRAARAECRQ